MDQLLEENYLPAGQPNMRKIRILVAPLDWGLGHATRCIPIIRELIHQNCDVWLAGEDKQQKLLQLEFPDLPFLTLEGYRIQYSRSSFLFSMIRQTRQIKRAIRKEHAWLHRMVNQHGFDAVISDNRYGLWHKKIPCIFMTHQLRIKSPLGTWTERILQKWNYRYINRFTRCWIPDNPGDDNLAGALSHPKKKPAIPLEYLGWLSRFHPGLLAAKKDHLVLLLSGPEPQRTILENMIIRDISHYPGTATIVRGLPGTANIIPSTGMIRFHNHLPTEELNRELQEAAFVIARSGYSTVMDLMRLQKKSILIPTPGQTEQEYLGQNLTEKKWALCISQQSFSLDGALKQASHFAYDLPPLEDSISLQSVISRFLDGLQKK